MFTGIIERMHELQERKEEGTNIHFRFTSAITNELKVDQSIAHDGVCLTVSSIEGTDYWVTAVEETLAKTCLSQWSIGDFINIERSMIAGGRLDGHIVQGHVDTTATVKEIEKREGSWMFTFAFPRSHAALIVPKGSICINGVSLTIVEAGMDWFSVTIIPYTYEHTGFHQFRIGQKVNVEFDLIGKYILRKAELYQSATAS